MKINQFATAMKRLQAEIELAAAEGLAEAADVIKEEAKEWIGRDHDEWPPLAEITDKEKTAAGFGEPDPLLRTGALRDSIEVRIHGLHAEIGTNNPYAPALEHGDDRLPPRPFLSTALRTKGGEAVGVIKKAIERAVRRTV